MSENRASMFSAVVLSCALLSGGVIYADEVPALDRNDGPFMVLARGFRGPQAESIARAVASELRKEHGLAASLHVVPGRNGLPEVAVLVGDCKTPEDAKALVHRIRKIRPACLANLPEGRAGLTRALQTTNPLVGFDHTGRPSR